jgi:hypothetical protein
MKKRKKEKRVNEKNNKKGREEASESESETVSSTRIKGHNMCVPSRYSIIVQQKIFHRVTPANLALARACKALS